MKSDPTMLQSMNPANGEVVGEVPITPVDRIPQIVHDARKAQVGWAALSLEERAKILIEAGKHLADHLLPFPFGQHHVRLAAVFRGDVAHQLGFHLRLPACSFCSERLMVTQARA